MDVLTKNYYEGSISRQSDQNKLIDHRKAKSKSLKRFGSSGRIRTYNPSVNSYVLAISLIAIRCATALRSNKLKHNF